MEKYLSSLSQRFGSLLLIVFIFVMCSTTLQATVSVTLGVLDQGTSNPASTPLCGSPSQPSYAYDLKVYSTSSSDFATGETAYVYIKFKDPSGVTTNINTLGPVSVSDFSTGMWQSTGSVSMFNAPANRDNGTIYGEIALSMGTYKSSTFAITAPFVTISPSSAAINTISGPTSVSLTASATSSSSFAWTPSSGLSATTGATVTASPGITRTYTVTATSTSVAGCTGTKTVTVTVTGPCCSSTRVFTNQTIVSDDVSNYITASGSSSIVASSTVSLKAGNYIQLDPDVSIAPSSGSFLAEATACIYNGCKIGFSEDDDKFVEPVLLDPNIYLENSDRIRIYPNPSSGLFTISSEERVDGVIVSNSMGNIISNTSGLQIDLSSQPEGVYFVSILSKGETVTKKVFKNK